MGEGGGWFSLRSLSCERTSLLSLPDCLSQQWPQHLFAVSQSLLAHARETVPFRGPGAKLIIGGVGETKEGGRRRWQQLHIQLAAILRSQSLPNHIFSFFAITTIAARGTSTVGSRFNALPLEKRSITHCGLGVLNRTLAILSIKPTAEVHLVSVVEIINSDQKHETSFP